MRQLALAALAVCALAGPARADLCADAQDSAPARVPLRDSGLDVARPVCPEQAMMIDVRGIALIDTPGFYGTLTGSTFFGLRAGDDRVELEGGMRVIDFRFVQNAVVTAHELAVGPVWIALTHGYPGRFLGRDAVWSWTGRLDLVATDRGSSVTTAAAALSAQGLLPLRRRLRLLGRVAALGWTAAPIDAPDGRVALSAAGDVNWQPRHRLALTGGVEVQGGWYGARLDHLLVRGGVRVRVGGYRLELSAAAPMLGAERTNLVVLFGLARVP